MTSGPAVERAVVVINPLSGRGRLEHQLRAHGELARDVLGRHGIEATVRPTTRAGDAMTFAREAAADGCPLVVVWGGDGTINEVARGLAHTSSVMAIVPAGSGNGLAAELSIPFEARAALEVAAAGATTAIDAGQIDDHLFFNIAGIGIDAVIASRFAERGLRRRGAIAYLQISAAELLRYECQTYRLTIDDERLEHRALLVALANGSQYGNGLRIAPGARLDDGQLEVVVVEPLSLWSIACRLPSVFGGRLQAGRGVTMRAARTLRVSADAPIPFHVDGEPRVGTAELAVQLHQRALRVRTPPTPAQTVKGNTSHSGI